ncbi:asparagine synthase (glutamine-hydrolyzing) [Desulfobulbus rhabdoformis]|uniref:asparagine synthase (glutamine-hydrolyzing) n=1 Tax=Desulfobulbus rhabdoformis TaxID=34032 RepID=UPI0019638388|nr:asparagine synthase (glutamine-hydrolyzing) [Desulfobulbus rhabdoformis]MBM9616710.1 asparagine synthase (glutamine-hydrolyzing) [Desulfobulbus rhabdoformis]
MCGIAGYLYVNRDQPVDRRVVEQMCSVIHHRGPDEWGMWCDGPVGIGMKRLRIIDLNGGQQPMANDDKSIHIVFNGEIYNHLQLRAELSQRGYRFRTSSDTEAILRMYEEYGEACVTRLRGMFAFAIWDGRNRSLFLARDRMGKKPLHYLCDHTKLVFGSEIKSILQHPEIHAEVNRPAIIPYLGCGYVPDPATMFKGINKLPPAHTLTWHEGKFTVNRYWNIEYRPDYSKTEQQWLAETEALLDEAVKIRMMSDVPLGAFLSGGIDSSLVVALMARNLGSPVKTFSIGFDEDRYNELPYARLVAQRYGTDHHEEIVRPDAEEIIPSLILMFDEPFADSSAIPTYYVSRLARRYVTVALSGDGGDEVFGGYDRYLDSTLSGRTDLLPLWLRQSVFGLPARLLPSSFSGINLLRYLAAEKDERYLMKMTKGISAIGTEVFSTDLIQEAGENDAGTPLRAILRQVDGHDAITRRQYLDSLSYLPGDIMTKVDRATMFVSLEARAPLLDHLLVEFAATMPVEYKIRGRVRKYILKQLAEKLLPRELIQRPKMGFALPVSQWINAQWAAMSQDLVLGERARQRGNFNQNYLNRIMTEHRCGRRDNSYIIWSLMMLEMWFRSHIDGHLSNVEG